MKIFMLYRHIYNKGGNMILVTGDTHGGIDINKIYKLRDYVNKGDYIIICGDFGMEFCTPMVNIHEWMKSIRILEDFETFPCDILFVDGNHENFDNLNSYPVTKWHGGTVHKMRENVIHLMRGQIYNINNKTFFTMGGATSIDKDRREPGISWWKEELPSEEEYNTALKNLKKANYSVDYIITHCAPTSFMKALNPSFIIDAETKFLEDVARSVSYNHWYFGHYHMDQKLTNYKATCLYNSVEEIKF